MRFVQVTFAIPSIDSLDKLYEDLSAALGGKYVYTSTGNGVVTVALSDASTPSDDATATQIVLTHDYNTRTAAQIATAQRKSDFQELVTGAAQALVDIGDELGILNGAPTAAQQKAILIANEQRQRAIIKALLRIADIIT